MAATIAPTATTARLTIGHRRRSRQRGTATWSRAATAASGPNTTAACTTSGWERESVDLHARYTARHAVGGSVIRVSDVPTDYTDDLRLAHVLADDADSITESRFRALDLHVMSKPDLTPVSDADHAVEESIRRTPAGAVSRRGDRRGARLDRAQPAPLGGGPDRRHQELRPRGARGPR